MARKNKLVMKRVEDFPDVEYRYYICKNGAGDKPDNTFSTKDMKIFMFAKRVRKAATHLYRNHAIQATDDPLQATNDPLHLQAANDPLHLQAANDPLHLQAANDPFTFKLQTTPFDPLQALNDTLHLQAANDPPSSCKRPPYYYMNF
ncbi:hypothetical protein HanIR_Chr03g0100391 [Helianthus annuus]|nr:hypothetical protein HanIR_Chr03g0100391 [Helianthus annuus]